MLISHSDDGQGGVSEWRVGLPGSPREAGSAWAAGDVHSRTLGFLQAPPFNAKVKLRAVCPASR